MLKSWCPNGAYNVGFLDLEYNSHNFDGSSGNRNATNTGLEANKVRD